MRRRASGASEMGLLGCYRPGRWSALALLVQLDFRRLFGADDAGSGERAQEMRVFVVVLESGA